MRTFDYEHLPEILFSGAVGDAAALVYADSGKLDLLKEMQPDTLIELEKRARFDNVDASLRIEGMPIDRTRLREILSGSAPDGELEMQAAGYARCLADIEENCAEIDLSTPTILKFYETLFGYRNLGHKSRYRKKDYMYVQVEGHMEAVPVSPVTAFETPLVLGGACDSLEGAFVSGAYSAIVLAAVFTVDFLCIRPFDEGNGRISRLFADLLLRKSGFDVARYASIDKVIEASAMDYYDALNSCVEGWDRNANDYGPFVEYWLNAIHAAYANVFEEIDRLRKMGSMSKCDRVREFVRKFAGPVRKRDIRDGLSDISEATVENELGRMVREGVARKVGGGRSTAYEWCGDDGRV